MRLVRLSLLVAAAVLPAAIVGSSCVIKGFEIEPETHDSGVPDSSDDVVVVGCQNALPPPPPPPTTSNPADATDIVVAVRSIDLGETKVDTATPVPGLDLDKVCTGGKNDEGPSCAYPAWATANHDDDEGGRDNAGARLFKYIQDSLGASNFGSDFYSVRADQGLWSLLIRVSAYNGQPDDGEVRVAVYPTKGVDDPLDAGVPTSPKWNGSDLWGVPSDAITNNNADEPLYVDLKAYVANGVLVASLPNAVFNLAGADGFFGIRLTGSTITGKLVNEGGQWRIDEGILAARWVLKDVFAAIGMMKVGGFSLCNDGFPLYTQVKTELCKYPDIQSYIGGPTQPCDAMSFGMGFSAQQAQLGAVYTAIMDVNMCAPGQDPALDSCDTLALPDAGAGGGMP